jgi:hypothetical protein
VLQSSLDRPLDQSGVARAGRDCQFDDLASDQLARDLPVVCCAAVLARERAFRLIAVGIDGEAQALNTSETGNGVSLNPGSSPVVSEV